MSLRLAIFDCDGTLVDSQHMIVAAMQGAFAAVDRPSPPRAQVLAQVGLSLDGAMRRLVPDADDALVAALTDHYRRHNQQLRRSGAQSEPLYEGIAELVAALDEAGWLLAVATGKSQRGLAHVLDVTGIRRHFVSLQTADLHPSKPHPAMVHAALAETGVAADDAVMIGDTSFDMEMALAAGVRALGVGWGYHAPEELIAAGAESVAMDSAQLAHHIGLP